MLISSCQHFSETANQFLRIAANGRYLETMYNRSSTASRDHVGMRISLAFFNTMSEVETLLDALATELSAFAPTSIAEVAKASVPAAENSVGVH